MLIAITCQGVISPVPPLRVALSGSLYGAAYTSIPTPLPGNVVSVGYEVNSISEFGNAVTLAPGGRNLSSATVVMSTWAPQSDWEPLGTSTGFNHPLTLNLYNHNPDGSVGSQLATLTVSAFVPWRPENEIACGGNGWMAQDGFCYSGMAFSVAFDFSSLNVALPDDLIVTLAFNTQHYGAGPLGLPGPYNSLDIGAEGGPSAGSNSYLDSAYMNSSSPMAYSDGGLGGLGTLRLDPSSWFGYSPEFQIDTVAGVSTVPEPSTFALIGAGLAAVTFIRRRRVR